MPLPALIGLAAKLLPFASVVPEVMRAFGSNQSADAAEKLVGVAQALTGEQSAEAAVNRIIADPALQLQYQQALIAERLEFARMEYADKQHAHEQQQQTIRTGDTSQDEYVRRTRPKVARQSWYGALLYILAFEAAKLNGYGSGASFELAMVLLAPCAAYLGFRTGDKFAQAWSERSGKK